MNNETLERTVASLNAERSEVEQLKEIQQQIFATLDRTAAANRRLRALIKEAEFYVSGCCPWCGAARGEKHRAPGDELFPELRCECRAFTPEGDVR